MKKKYGIVTQLLLVIPVFVFGQTVPTAQSLPYSEDFTALAFSSTTFPAGWQGWQLSTSGSSASFRTSAPTANIALTASCNAGTTGPSILNYNGKLGILASTTSDPSLCLAINTTGQSGVAVTFDVGTLRNPYNGAAENRRNNVELQYRIGSSTGTFTSLTGTIYRNNTTTQIAPTTTAQNASRFRFTLPAACNNQAVVQLRWVQRDSAGTTTQRPSFCIDNVIVCSAPVVSVSTTPACNGQRTGSITLNISGGISPYNVVWDTINKTVAGPTFAVTVATKTSQHPYFGVGFSSGYVIDGIQGKELTVVRGVQYTFSGTFPGHPFHITTSTTGGNFSGEVSSGVTNNELQGGALAFTPNASHPVLLWYHCGVHLNMGWKININNGYATQNLTNMPAGTYTAAFSSSDGCTTNITVTISTGTSPVIVASSNSPVCENDSLGLNATGGVNYSWTGPNVFTSNAQHPFIKPAEVIHSGTYQLTGTNASGCSGTSTVNVVIQPRPEINMLQPDSGLAGDTISISGNDFTVAASLKFNGTNASFSVSNDTLIKTVVPGGTTTGGVLINSAQNCASNTPTFTILTSALLQVNLFLEGLYLRTDSMKAVADAANAPWLTDTIEVLLYEPGGTIPVNSCIALLTIHGESYCTLPLSFIGNSYYIVVRCRNAIETWSKNPVAIIANTKYDFRY